MSWPQVTTSKCEFLLPPNGFSLGHCNIRAYSMQCSGKRGIEAIVHMGKLIYKDRWILADTKWPGSAFVRWLGFSCTLFYTKTCNLTWGGYSSRVQSMQAVMPGRMTLALPLKPSVPPSIRGIIDPGSKTPSSYSSNDSCTERQKDSI